MRKYGVLVGLFTLFLVLAPSSTGAQIEGRSFPITVTPCPVAPDLEEVEGETVICGTVTVPEDYAEPDETQINLTFAILKSASLSPASDPVIYLHGGPGAAELRDLAKMSERFAPLRQTRDVIIFDQRGTGFSPGPLTCDVEVATQRDDVEAYVLDYSGGYGDTEFAVNRALFASCLKHFADVGADLAQYNTVNNARDVVELASALGYKGALNLYGFSYGTQVALEVMRQHPERLRSVILDSVAPADLKLYENMGQPNVEAITSLFAICAADEDCNENFPDLDARFAELLERLDTAPIYRTDGSLVTAATVVNALRQQDIRAGLGAYLPLMIWELDQGNTATLDAILDNKLPPPSVVQSDPMMLRYADKELDEDAQFFIQTALTLRQEADDINALADRLLRRGDEQLSLSQSESSAAGRFDLRVHELVSGYPFDKRLALNEAYLAFPVVRADHTVADLQAFINEHFDGSDARRLSLLAEGMSDEDVETLAQLIFAKARGYATFFNVALALHLYVCQEHIPFNTMDGALATFEMLDIPQVARGKLGTVSNIMAYCDLFPTGVASADFHEPVESDIPALILLGTADTQTATSWGEHAAESLEKSQVVIFPETGHGTFLFSQCAKDIGAAFLSDPDDELNVGCTGDLRPAFVLPPTN